MNPPPPTSASTPNESVRPDTPYGVDFIPKTAVTHRWRT